MKIQYASDLHLEMSSNTLNYWDKNKIEPVGDVLVLAGDITRLSKTHYTNNFFDQVSEDFKHVIIVPGNHEYYHISNPNLIKEPSLEIELRHNVHYYNNKVVKIDDVNFICSTLWSNIPQSDAFAVVRGVACFENIQHGRNKINVEKWNNLHGEAKNFIVNAVADLQDEKKVVVTHHVPTKLCVATEHKNSSINTAFATELYEIIKYSKIDYWIYGHSHRSIDVEINGTNVVSNQFGYFSWGEHLNFNTKCFDI